MASFEQNKSRVGKAAFYFLSNAIFAVLYGLGLFTLVSGSCYTTRTSSVPVLPETPGAVNTGTWYTLTLLLGFVAYLTSSLASLGYFLKPSAMQRKL